GNGGQRTLAPPAQGELRRGRHVLRVRLRTEWIAPGEVDVDRPRAGIAGGGRPRAAGGRAKVEEAGVVGIVGADLAEPANSRPVQLELVDCLPRADPAQLRR